MSKVFRNRPLPATHYTAIGEVAVQWSWLEYLVQIAIWQLLDVPRKEGRVVTSHMNIRPNLDVLAQLTERRVKDKTTAQEIEVLARKIERRSEVRNRIVHGLWAFSDESREPYSIMYKGRYRVLGRAYDYDETKIHAFIKEIVRYGDRLNELMAKHAAA